MTTQTKARTWNPSPKAREYLAAWPAGEERTVDRLRREAPFHAGVGPVTSGYLRRREGISGHWWDAVVTRTDKPIRPYVPRGPKEDYVGHFPWSADEHWRRIEASPIRLPHVIAHELTGQKRKDRGFRVQDRALQDSATCPLQLRTRATFNDLRQLLPHLFEMPLLASAKDTRTKRLLDGGHRYAIPTTLWPAFYTAAAMRALFLEMLVEPVTTDGRYTHFQALDPEAAATEYRALTGTGLTIPQRYAAQFR